MLLDVYVTANARREGVSRRADGSLTVAVRAPARDGKANEAVVLALAAYLGVAPSRIAIRRGHAGRHKVLRIS